MGSLPVPPTFTARKKAMYLANFEDLPAAVH